MKKWTSLFLLFCLLTLPVSAEIRVMVNNNPVQFDSPPTIEDGRTLVPMRFIFEALGAEVTWDDAAKTATGKRGDITVSVPIGKTTTYINSTTKALDVPAKIIGGRTMVPARFVAESFGCDVKWQQKTETVWITDGNRRAVRPLSVHFIDVGQADSILVLLPNGEDMLIDAGQNGDGDDVVAYLTKQGVTDIEYAVGTHPHADHIGGMDDVLKAIPTDILYMPAFSADTKTYKDVLAAAEEKNVPIQTAGAGITVYNSDGLSITMVAPVGDSSDPNDASAVLLVTYLNRTFLFTGDAEAKSEEEIQGDIAADVLKVGHHGASTSSTAAFLNRVKPQYAVISVGKGNSYGHPTDQTLSRLSAIGAAIFRTDEEGTIVFTSDGDSLSHDAA